GFKPPAKVVRVALPAQMTTVVGGKTASELAVGVSKAIFRSAPAVVLVAAGDEADLPQAADRAQKLGVPVLVTPSQGDPATGVADEIKRLAPKTVVPIGPGATTWFQQSSPASSPVSLPVSSPANDPVAVADIRPDEPLTDLLVLTVNVSIGRAASATAKAAGARILALSNSDPRTDAKAIDALAHEPTEHVLAIGAGFGSAEQLRARVDTA